MAQSSKYRPLGQFTKLYTLCSQTNCAYGIGPLAALTQGTDGSFYGTTPYGGIFNDTCFNGCGIVFRFSTGLAAFVKPNPTFGKVGYKTNILGNNLSSTTSVTFNGVAATFSIVSDTFIKAIVPSGATTGTIQVTTPTGKHSSNVAFQVIP